MVSCSDLLAVIVMIGGYNNHYNSTFQAFAYVELDVG